MRASLCGIMILGLILCMGNVAAADSFSITLVDGDWVNSIPTVTINNSGSSGGLSTARWGIPTDGIHQSGYDFDSLTTPFSVQSNGTPFALGTFTHLNYPIGGTSLDSINLDVHLEGTPGSIDVAAIFHISHDETPNNYYPPTNPGNNDIVTITNPILNEEFSYNGKNYFFNLIGFSQDGGQTITTQFSTVETLENVAILYGEITEAPVPTVPEPSTFLLIGGALAGLATHRFRNRKA